MLVVKTPLRISFFGGGSDIPKYYQNYAGLCISTTINSYIYLAMNRCIPKHLKIVYSIIEQVTNIDDLKHDIVKASLRYFDITSNLELCSFSDITSKGTGLGSSSTFAVGLLNGLNYLKHRREMSPKILAELASWIEIECCQSPIGKQDQYAAAYGGLNSYQFTKEDVIVEPIKITPTERYVLEDNLLLFNTGITRETRTILKDQFSDGTNYTRTATLVDFAKTAKLLLESGQIDEFGELLDSAWKIKKSLSSKVSNLLIDEAYEAAKKNGALGGKICGAGGGGYLLLYVPQEDQYKVKSVLQENFNMEELKFKFTDQGSMVESA